MKTQNQIIQEAYISMISEGSDKEHSLESITRGIKKIHTELNDVNSQDEYDKFLKTHKNHAGVIDKYFGGNTLHDVANKLHYHQRLDSGAKSFLDNTIKHKLNGKTN